VSHRSALLNLATLLGVLASVLAGVAGSAMGATPSAEGATADQNGWKPTWIKQADANGGWVLRNALIRFVHFGDGGTSYHDSESIQFIPFGVQQMDTDEIALIGAIDNNDNRGWPHNQTNEGSLVRAANGWLVAALRITRPLQFRNDQGTDNLNGMGVSVSRDDGVHWSPVQTLYRAGRMHSHLIVLPGGEIVLTYIERQDIENGHLVSYRRGAGAVVSYDNGLTWDMAHRFLLGDFEFADETPYALACGHQWSALLDDGHILTVFGHYPSRGACLVKWKVTLRR